ncbi:MAG: aminopeptidase P N-terminal domain-containing protein, partial [Gemmatimonadota bacterium]
MNPRRRDPISTARAGDPPAPGPARAFPAELLAARRDRLLQRLGDGIAIVPAAPELRKSRDTEVLYRQSSDLYYLTGMLEPDAVAVLTPHDPDHRFTIFVRPRDPGREAWSGPRMGVEGAAEALGADSAYPIDELPDRLPGLLREADRIHYPISAVRQLDTFVAESLVRARSDRQRSGAGPTGLVDLEAVTGELRVIKDAEEVERIRTAADIAVAGHLAAMQRARPGTGEWEIQAVLESTFRAHGATGPAFPSIVGSGANATVLHYVANQSRVSEGDLVLIDAGAEWGMYCSDITRTVPASGRFSASQRDLYDIVLAAENAGIHAAIPGAAIADVHHAAIRTLAAGLIDMGVLEDASPDDAIEAGSIKRFYMHQTSHWLGLDVHDVGLYERAGEPVELEPGMVLTVEPGLYIPADADDVPDAFR